MGDEQCESAKLALIERDDARRNIEALGNSGRARLTLHSGGGEPGPFGSSDETVLLEWQIKETHEEIGCLSPPTGSIAIIWASRKLVRQCA